MFLNHWSSEEVHEMTSVIGNLFLLYINDFIVSSHTSVTSLLVSELTILKFALMENFAFVLSEKFKVQPEP